MKLQPPLRRRPVGSVKLQPPLPARNGAKMTLAGRQGWSRFHWGRACRTQGWSRFHWGWVCCTRGWSRFRSRLRGGRTPRRRAEPRPRRARLGACKRTETGSRDRAGCGRGRHRRPVSHTVAGCPAIDARIRQSTPNRMRLSARRPLVAAEFGARGIPVRRAPQLYDQSAPARIPWRRASTHTGHPPQPVPSSPRPSQREAGPTPGLVPGRVDPRGWPLPRRARTCGTMEA